MSFTEFATGANHAFGGSYQEIRQPEFLRYTDRFDDPNLPGEMKMTVEFKPVSVGTEVVIRQENLPDAVPPEACHLGWQQSLTLLARLVETP